jgi:hypothetical protein
LQVWIVEEQTHAHVPVEFSFENINIPMNTEIDLNPYPNRAKNYRVSGNGYQLPSLLRSAPKEKKQESFCIWRKHSPVSIYIYACAWSCDREKFSRSSGWHTGTQARRDGTPKEEEEVRTCEEQAAFIHSLIHLRYVLEFRCAAAVMSKIKNRTARPYSYRLALCFN